MTARGPKPGASKRAGQHLANATAAWGDPLPLWVAALARACDAASLSEVGKRIGYSGAAVSQTINRKYGGDLAAVEKATCGVLLAQKVDCPVMGLLAANDCLANQRQGFSTGSRLSVQLAMACPNCAHRQGATRHG